MKKIFPLFILCFSYFASLNGQITSPTALPLNNPIVLSYEVTAGQLEALDMQLTTTGNYANFTLYADGEIIADNMDLPASGTYDLNALVRFPQTGTVELTLTSTGSDITVEYLTLSSYSGVSFPDFNDVTDGSGIVDESSLKYSGPSIADINNDGNYDFILNNHNDSPSKLFWSNGDGTFTKQDPNLSLWNLMDLHGSAAGDYDNDGDLDILITLGGGNGTNPAPPVFYRNDNGTLVRDDAGVGILTGARGRSPRWADLDLDGDLDLMLFNAEGINGNNDEQHIFYENLGNGTFQTRNIAGLEGVGGDRVLLTDLDNDHIDDIVLFSPLSIWKGNGDFTFTNVNQWLNGLAGTYGIMAAADIDMDNDGDLDLYLSRGQGYFVVAEQNAADFLPSSNQLDLRTSGSEGTLPFEITADGAITISGLDFTNRNGYSGGYPLYLGSTSQEEILDDSDDELVITQAMADGWPATRTENGLYIGHIGGGVWKVESVRNEDIFWSIHYSFDGVTSFTPTGWTPNNRNSQDILLRNDNESFVDVSDEWNIPIGGNHWGVTRGDFNNDSYQDLYVYRFGYLKNRLADYMLLNNGQGGFEITTAHSANNAGASSHGDMGQAFDHNLDGHVDLLNGDDEYGTWHLYENESLNNGNYVLVRVGYGPSTNVDPISAEVIVYTPGNEYLRRVGSAGEAHSQSLLNTIHFGLGDETAIDSIAVRWRNGETYVIKDLLTVDNLYDTDNVPPLSIDVIPPITDVREGTSKLLDSEIGPINANQDVIWASSNDAAVSVDADGIISGIILGEVVTITATTVMGGLIDSSIVTVVEWYPIDVESINVSPDTLLLFEGGTGSLLANILPIDADTMDVIWTSSDAAIATVDTDGIVTAVAEGMALVTATTVNGGFQDNSVVIVSPLVDPFVAFDDESIYVNTIYQTSGTLDVTCSYHAGSGNTVIGGTAGGVKFWLREMEAGWAAVANDYTVVDATALNTESGVSSASISLETAIPTAELPAGSFYFLWINFFSSNGNSYDTGLVNINIEGASSIEEEEGATVNVHPIPATDYIYLTGLAVGEYEARIFDMQGNLILKTMVENNGLIPVQALSSGAYILNVKGEEVARSFKIIKMQ